MVGVFLCLLIQDSTKYHHILISFMKVYFLKFPTRNMITLTSQILSWCCLKSLIDLLAKQVKMGWGREFLFKAMGVSMAFLFFKRGILLQNLHLRREGNDNEMAAQLALPMLKALWRLVSPPQAGRNNNRFVARMLVPEWRWPRSHFGLVRDLPHTLNGNDTAAPLQGLVIKEISQASWGNA